MTRKSPFHHKVKSHTRKGKTVHSYERGAGDRPKKIAKLIPSVGTKQKISLSYVTTINYLNLPTEIFPVNASSFPKAIDTAMVTRQNITPPQIVEVTKL